MIKKTPTFSPPSPHRYPVMTNLFRTRLREYDDCFLNDAQVDQGFGRNAQHVYALRADILARLLDVIHLSYSGDKIESLTQLDELIRQENACEGSDENPVFHLSHENGRLHALYYADINPEINWGRLVSLLNEIEAEQAENIRSFLSFLDIDLDELLETGQLGFDLPVPSGGCLPRQEFSGNVFILDPANQKWIREDIYASKLKIVLHYEDWDEETDSYMINPLTIAQAGSLEDALLISVLYLDNIRQYIKDSTDYQNAIGKNDSAPFSIEIRVGTKTIVQGNLKQALVDADDRKPDNEHLKMIKICNTWERRIDPESIHSLEAKIKTDSRRWSEAARGDEFDRNLSENIAKNKRLIDTCNFYIKNEDLMTLIFKVDERLGSFKHKTEYFIQDLGI